jgi:hypothetical protein
MYLKTIGTALVAMGVAFAGSALAEGMQGSPPAAQSGAFCLQKQGGAADCKYQTMAACESAKAGSDQCIQNPRATTGSGAAGSGTRSPATGSPPSQSR